MIKTEALNAVPADWQHIPGQVRISTNQGMIHLTTNHKKMGGCPGQLVTAMHPR